MPQLARHSLPDRPGWIPASITQDWDPNPYAYQTEEELMPAGGLHGQLLAYIMELLRVPLFDKGLMLLLDTFLVYRDAQNTLQRIAPDLLLMPYRDPPPLSYHLDREPPPTVVVELTSPSSRRRDLQDKAAFYGHLGVEAYLAIDAITVDSQLRDPHVLHYWRRVQGRWRSMPLDPSGWLAIAEMGLEWRVQGRLLQCRDSRTGQLLWAGEQWREALQAETQRTKQVHQRAKQADQRAEQEYQRAEQADQRAEQEYQRAEHADQRAEQEHQRAEQECQRAEQADQRAKREAQRAERLAARLRALGLDPDLDNE